MFSRGSLLRCLCSSALLASLASLSPNPGIAAPLPPPIAVDALGKASIPLDGLWQFHIGDDLSWASPTFDDSTWQPIKAGHTGFAWYRRHLSLPPENTKAFNLALYLPGVQDAYEVYWNGVLVGKCGKVPPQPSWFLISAPRQYELGPAQTGVLAIGVWKAPHVYAASPEEGGIVAVPVLGSNEAIAGLETAADYRQLRSSQYDLALLLLSTLVGVFAFLTWLRRPH